MIEPALDRHLYVVGDASAHVGFLNCERIAERSHIHGWQVAPHYHEGLAQFFCFASGRVRGQVDYEPVDVRAPAVVWMPALVSHGFHYPAQMEGWVVTFPSAVLSRLVATMPWLSSWLSRAAIVTGEPHAAELVRLLALFEAIEREHGRFGEERDTVLEALVRLVLTEMHRGLRRTGGEVGGVSDRRFNLVRQFQILVDRDYGLQRSVSDYAAELAVTPTHLSRCIKALTGRTAGEVIHDRLILEARRLLAFTNLPIADIAYRLNFSTPTYFTRFFAGRTGDTPTDFRERMRLFAAQSKSDQASVTDAH